MNKKIMILATLAIVAVLTSSLIVTSLGWRNSKQEYVGYKLEALTGEPTITNINTQGAPNIIIETVIDNIFEFTVTIGDEVYTYPGDFDVISTQYTEFNAITGNGFTRVEGKLVFNLPSNPTLNYNVVNQISGYKMGLDGTLLTPEARQANGDLLLSGTQKFNSVEGFGLSEAHFAAPQYTQMQHIQFGLIKGWPL
jgi:hypothetical protein